MFQFISLMQFNFDFIIIVNKQRIFLQPLKIKAKPVINVFLDLLCLDCLLADSSRTAVGASTSVSSKL